MAETFLWNFIKNTIHRYIILEKKMFKEKIKARMDAQTDGQWATT